MNFLKISPLRFFALGAFITLALNLALYVSQLVDDPDSGIKIVKSPKFASQVETWFAGNSNESSKPGQVYQNGMGMRFVKLPDSDIAFGVYEVTREQFRFFADSVGLEDQRWLNRITQAGISQPDNHPIVNVSWHEANQFCEWLSKQENAAFRLPTDYEWSIAAGLAAETSFLSPCLRSKETPEEFFWGKSWDTDRAFENYADKSHETLTGTAGCFAFDDGFPATAPVGSFLPNALGIYDMGGNVSEWVYDWYRSRDEFKTVRGASYGSGTIHREVHFKGFRAMSTPTFRSELFGFRIIAEEVDKLQPVPAGQAAVRQTIPQPEPAVELASSRPLFEPAYPSEYTPPAYNNPAPGIGDAAIVEPFPTFTPQPPAQAPVPETVEPIVEPVPVVVESNKEVRVTYTGKDGINLRRARSFASGNKLGAVFAQSADPLVQIGDDSRVDTETWVNIEVKGWIPTKNSTHTYLKNQGNGSWKVVWSKPGDRYVSMRAGASSDDTLVSKVSYGTEVEELDTKWIGKRHYIYGKITGWVVKKNKKRAYIADL